MSPRPLFALALVCALVDAAVFLPAIFRDGVVLQTPADGGGPARVFGYADPGEAVVVNQTVYGPDGTPTDFSTYSATGDATTGRWSVLVVPPADDLTPLNVSLSVAAASDASPVVISNATYGDVLICSGQSNQVLSVAGASCCGKNASFPLQTLTLPFLRLYSVITQNMSTPQRDFPPFVNSSASRCSWGYVPGSVSIGEWRCQEWQTARPNITDWFSAECAYTAWHLWQSGAVPANRTIGLVQSAYSGTAMETWIPPEAADGCPPNPYGEGEGEAVVGAAAVVGSAAIPNASQCLWNSMINPMVGFGLRAFLFNQIESNMGDPFVYYACVFQNMIAAWRERWGSGDVPFLATQLGDQGYSWPSYVESPRDGQLAIFPGRYGAGVSRTPNAGIVSAYDQGDRFGNPFGVFNVHSRYKEEIGRRMALLLATVANLTASSSSAATAARAAPSSSSSEAAAGAAPSSSSSSSSSSPFPWSSVDWDGPRPLSADAINSGASVVVTFGTASGKGVFLNGTRDCWECCNGTAALDTFQLAYLPAAANFTNSSRQEWTNTTWTWDASTARLTLTPTVPAHQGRPWVVVRYAASLWPQCAVYSASNNVPALSFSDLSVGVAGEEEGGEGEE
jgi:sialate O-acetylesterase